MSKTIAGCSPLTSTIFVGTLLKDGRRWSANKKDITDTAPMAVAQHLIQLNESIEFNHNNGKKYRLQVVEIKD